LLVLAIAVCGSAASSAAALARDKPPAAFQVVVNAANTVASIANEDVAKIFLKRTDSWPSGGIVQPVDLREDSDVRREFSKQVLGKDVASVKGYWQERIFTGRGVPPIEKASEAEALAFIAANKDAIGYVSADAHLPAGVKAVRLTH